jgi:hypothetical protein
MVWSPIEKCVKPIYVKRLTIKMYKFPVQSSESQSQWVEVTFSFTYFA